MRLLTILLMLLPFSAKAEGARMVLDCQVTTRCDATGACEPADQPRQIELAPQDIDADGVGTYGVSEADQESEAQALSRTGPYVWTDATGVRHSLTLTSEETAIALSQDFNNGAQTYAAYVLFMNCTVTL